MGLPGLHAAVGRGQSSSRGWAPARQPGSPVPAHAGPRAAAPTITAFAVGVGYASHQIETVEYNLLSKIQWTLLSVRPCL